MYVEARTPDGRLRLARIARVRFSKRWRSVYFEGREFLSRGEYIDVETRETHWFSGPRKDGNDRGGTQAGSFPIEIDEDVRREYRTEIRGLPERAGERVTYG